MPMTCVTTYKSGVVVSSLLTDLAAYYALGEASGTRADSTAHHYDLAPTNTPGNAAGKVGNAVQLHKSSNQALSPTDSSPFALSAGDFTAAGWVYWDSTTDPTQLITKDDGSSNREYVIQWNPNVPALRMFMLKGITAILDVGSFTPSTGTWYFLVAWHDATAKTLNLQIDNGTIHSQSYTGTPTTGTATFYLGLSAEGGNAHDGRLDEVGVWSRVLTTDERTSLYNGGSGTTYPF